MYTVVCTRSSASNRAIRPFVETSRQQFIATPVMIKTPPRVLSANTGFVSTMGAKEFVDSNKRQLSV